MIAKYTHVIFDLDGTLVDSATEIHFAAADICSREGIQAPTLDYIRAHTGSHPSNFFRDHGAQETRLESLVYGFRKILKEHAGDPACVFESAEDLLSKLKSYSIRISLATTKPTELAGILLRRYGLSDYFDHVQGTDPPMQHKPSPDIIQACLDFSPSSCAVMVGDTAFDVEAATNAGIDSVGICSGTHSSDRLMLHNPTYLISSLNDLAEIFQLP